MCSTIEHLNINKVDMQVNTSTVVLCVANSSLVHVWCCVVVGGQLLRCWQSCEPNFAFPTLYWCLTKSHFTEPLWFVVPVRLAGSSACYPLNRCASCWLSVWGAAIWYYTRLTGFWGVCGTVQWPCYLAVAVSSLFNLHCGVISASDIVFLIWFTLPCRLRFLLHIPHVLVGTLFGVYLLATWPTPCTTPCLLLIHFFVVCRLQESLLCLLSCWLAWLSGWNCTLS